MKILVIGKFGPEAFALHISETLVSMGHVVMHYEPVFKSRKLESYFRNRLDQINNSIYSLSDNIPFVRKSRINKLWDIVDDADLDLIIVCKDFLWPEEVMSLKKKSKALVIMWFPDSIIGFDRGMFMNAPYDAIFFKDPFIIYTLKDVLKIPLYYLPECFNPKRHFLHKNSIIDTEYYCEIVTAGDLHPWRIAFFENLSEWDVKIWGAAPALWNKISTPLNMYQGKRVYYEEKAKAFLGAKIVINNLLYSEIWGVNVRTFEAAGIGAFQLVDNRPAIKDLFIEGKEIITFNSIADLKNKIKYWLPLEDKRKEIALAAKERAYNEHTYEHRINLLFNTLSGKAQGYKLEIPS